MSANHIDPDAAVEFFLLEPHEVETADSASDGGDDPAP